MYLPTVIPNSGVSDSLWRGREGGWGATTGPGLHYCYHYLLWPSPREFFINSMVLNMVPGVYLLPKKRVHAPILSSRCDQPAAFGRRRRHHGQSSPLPPPPQTVPAGNWFLPNGNQPRCLLGTERIMVDTKIYGPPWAGARFGQGEGGGGTISTVVIDDMLSSCRNEES